MTQDVIDKIAADVEILDEPLEVIIDEVVELEVIKHQSMKDDLEYTIQKLRNNIDNSERLINKITLDMLSDDEDMGELHLRYTDLNAGMNKNLELLQKARKDISVTIANLAKAKTDKIEVKSITNNLTIDGGAVSTADIIAKLKNPDA